jgi:hypothetical protein
MRIALLLQHWLLCHTSRHHKRDHSTTLCAFLFPCSTGLCVIWECACDTTRTTDAKRWRSALRREAVQRQAALLSFVLACPSIRDPQPRPTAVNTALSISRPKARLFRASHAHSFCSTGLCIIWNCICSSSSSRLPKLVTGPLSISAIHLCNKKGASEIHAHTALKTHVCHFLSRLSKKSEFM